MPILYKIYKTLFFHFKPRFLMLDRYRSDKINKVGDFCYHLDDAHTQLYASHHIHTIFTAFENQGFEIRIVGGAVRDILMGRVPKDFDFATTAQPGEIEEVCSRNGLHCVPTGLKHGTITVVLNKRPYEITTLRVDKETNGRHACVEFIKDWKIDAERRDLTVNSMSISSNGMLYDYFGGLKDLQNEKIRFVNDPRERIIEDHLRILRYFRFYPKISHKEINENSFDKNVLEIIKDLSSNLKKIAKERIWMELSQIIISKYSPGILRLMKNLNVLKNCQNMLDSQFDYDRFYSAHSGAIGREHIHEIPKIMAASLLAAFFEDDETARSVCLDLKLSKNDISACSFIISNRNEEKITKNNKNEHKFDLKRYKKILLLNYKPPRLDYITDLVTQLMLYHGESNEDILKFRSWKVPAFPLRGNDVEPFCEKKKISLLMDFVKEKWIDSDYSLNKEDLIEICKEIKL